MKETSARSPLVFGLVAVGLLPAVLVPVGCTGEYTRPPRVRPGLVSATAQEPPRRPYDVEHYSIDLTLEPETRTIIGTCRVRLMATVDHVPRIELDLHGLEVRGVRDETGKELAFARDGDTLLIEMDVPLDREQVTELAVRYGGQPRTGLWFSGERADGSGPTQVFTQGQAEHNRGWFPCFDHPSDRATSEIRVTMPADWVSLAPGELIDSQTIEENRIDHWRMETPHATYLMSLVAGELVVAEAEWEGIPLLFAAEPAYRAYMEACFGETDEILSFLSDYIGIRYPYPKYSQAAVANFPGGGMENISATTLTPLTFDDEKGLRDDQSTGLVAHEAAHQWFGDLLTCDDWSHIWINEGFATYMTLLYVEATRGEDEFRCRLRDAQDVYLEQDRGTKRRPTVWPVWKQPEDLFDTRTYQGAASRLHLLRYVVGEEAFRDGVRTFAAEYAGRNVVTDDFKRVMEKVSGRDLDTFFAQWFYGRGYPEFDVAWSWDDKRSRVTVDVKQTQTSGDGTPAVFRLPVDIEVMDEGGTSLHRVQLIERKHRFDFEVSGRPFYVRFDKGHWIPKRITWKKTGAEWLAIAHADDDVNGRRDAVRALGRLAKEMKRRNDLGKHATYVAELVDRLINDENAWVRADAALGLGGAGRLEARARLQTAASSDPEARVRVAALKALETFGESLELAEFARQVFADGYSWATMGAAAGLVCTSDPNGAYAWMTEKLFTDSPHDQLRGYLFAHLGELPNQAVDDQLRRWAEDTSVHPSARGEALLALSKRTREIVANSRFVAGYLDEENFRLRRAAVKALVAIDDDNARRSLEAHYGRTTNPGERRAIEGALRGRRLR